MKSVLSLLLLSIAFHAKANVALNTEPSFESPGQYRVGFRTVTLDDPWRRNNLVLNMKDPPLQRRVLVNIWYPTLDEGRMIHADYLQGKEPYVKTYLQAYDRFRRSEGVP